MVPRAFQSIRRIPVVDSYHPAWVHSGRRSPAAVRYYLALDSWFRTTVDTDMDGYPAGMDPIHWDIEVADPVGTLWELHQASFPLVVWLSKVPMPYWLMVSNVLSMSTKSDPSWCSTLHQEP